MLNFKMIFKLLMQVTILLPLLFLQYGCGNKGDLFLESDAEAARELEEAAKKLKKKQEATPAPADSTAPAE